MEKQEILNNNTENIKAIKNELVNLNVQKNMYNSLEESIINSNPILKNIDLLKENNNFKKVILKTWEYLFKQWEINNNLYFILDWHISIEKYLWDNKEISKSLATLWKWDFFWEWSIKNTNPKEVNVLSLDNSELLVLDWKVWMADFIKENLNLWLELLIHIIDISNKRLLEANALFTTSYEMSSNIANIKAFDNRNLFAIIDKFSKIINADYILYLERNIVMKNINILKYDTRETWKIQENIIDLWDKKLDIIDIEKDWIILSKNNTIQNLINWDELIWYLVLWKQTRNFSSSELKIISSISTSIAWIIEQKRFFEEEKNKINLKSDYY